MSTYGEDAFIDLTKRIQIVGDLYFGLFQADKILLLRSGKPSSTRDQELRLEVFSSILSIAKQGKHASHDSKDLPRNRHQECA